MQCVKLSKFYVNCLVRCYRPSKFTYILQCAQSTLVRLTHAAKVLEPHSLFYPWLVVFLDIAIHALRTATADSTEHRSKPLISEI